MHKSLRILAIDDSPNDVETLSSAIKAAGFGVSIVRVNTEDEFQQNLESHNPNLILYRLKNGSPSFPFIVDAVELSGSHIPIIAIADGPTPATSACMSEGAIDRVEFEDTEHLKLVVKRTASNFSQWQDLIAAKAQLIEAQQRCSALMDSSKDAIAFIHEGMHIHANDAYLELFGYNHMDDIEALPMMDLVATDEHKKFKTFLRDYQKNPDGKKDLEIKILLPGDQSLLKKIEFTPASIDGEPCTQVVIRSQGDEDTASTSQADYLNEYDISSGLYNRKFLLDTLNKKLDSSEKSKDSAALILLGIDGYKDIQASLGVIGADMLFNEIGQLLKKNVAEPDIVARFDTSTFAVISQNVQGQEELIKSIQEQVADNFFEIEGKSTACTLSAGATTIDEHAPAVNELIARATKSLDEALESGASIKIYTPSQGELSQKQIDQQWDDRLRNALKENRLQLVYQPIISLLGDNVERYNVFTQLVDTDGSIVPARDFMPSAERIGFAQGLDRWVLLKSLKMLTGDEVTDQNIVFFIKLTAGTLQKPEEFNWYQQQILSHEIEASKLVFEIKTDTLSNHIKAASEFSKLIHSLGCKLAVDDFGSASDPFQLAKHLQPDFLKIGSDYSKDISSNDENKETVRRLIQQAHDNKQEVIVQHIEDAQQLTTLWGLNTNYVQGNFLQAPTESLQYDFGAAL